MSIPLLLGLGLTLLLAGAEALVRGASRLAVAGGVSPLVVGLTVVAFGTSSPELAVSVEASLGGRPGLAVGNVVGSNVFNVLFILGLVAIVAPVPVHRDVIRREVPLVAIASALLLGLVLDGLLGRLEGLFLFLLLLAYLIWSIGAARRATSGEPPDGENGPAGAGTDRGSPVAPDAGRELAPGSLPGVGPAGRRSAGRLALDVLLVLVGLATLVTGARWFVEGATGVAVACLPIFTTGRRIDRWEGVLFLGYYGAYVAYLVLEARAHEALPAYGAVMLGFVVPITVVTLLVLAVRARRAPERRDEG